MDLTQKKKGRPQGSENAQTMYMKANKAFDGLFQAFNQDLTKVIPNQRIDATIQLAGILLNTKKTMKKANNQFPLLVQDGMPTHKPTLL